MSSDIKTVNLTIALPPRYLGKEDKAIEEKLDKLKSQYVPEADGVLIKWSDLNKLNDRGIIIDDQPFIFYRVTFTAHIFKPIEGKLVKEAYLEHEVVKQLMVTQEVYFKIKGSSEGVYRGELDDECLELTSNSIKEESNADKNVYDYAKDFEY